MKSIISKRWISLSLSGSTLIFLFSLMTSKPDQNPELQTVSKVDIKKYSGKWFEIASFPQRFQRNCYGTSAEYTIHEKGYVIVENRCNKDSINGKESYIKGEAFPVEGSGDAKLRVQFFWPFKGDYWIIDLADDYSYAVVSTPIESICGFYQELQLWTIKFTRKLLKDL